ncbi:MAG: phage holin family protein [Bacteroidetes bacterium]|nr:phage holin family protein [Bacteroidota bacterium]
MNFIIRLLISTAAVMLTALLLPGVQIEGNSFFTALLVAIVLAFLNAVVKPVLTILSLPITFFTLGLFLLVINAIIILLADKLVDGFHVKGFWSALFFSIILAIINSILDNMSGNKRPEDTY